MKKYSSNIKPFYGRMVEGVNYFPTVELTSESIKNLLSDYTKLHMKLHMKRTMNPDYRVEAELIQDFLSKYNLSFNEEIENLTTESEYLQEYIEGSAHAPMILLSVPKFKFNEEGILFLDNGNLILGNRLIPEGFKFTFDVEMEEALIKLPTATVGFIEKEVIDGDIYEMDSYIEEGDIEYLINLYNTVGLDEVVDFLKKDKYETEEAYFTARSCTFKLQNSEEKFDYYFSYTIQFHDHLYDAYDCYYIRWDNPNDKYAFMNIESGVLGEEELVAVADSEIFDNTYKYILSYEEFMDMIVSVNEYVK